MGYLKKQTLINDIEELMTDIDDGITKVIKARLSKDEIKMEEAHYNMERLMVSSLQELSLIKEYLEEETEE